MIALFGMTVLELLTESKTYLWMESWTGKHTILVVIIIIHLECCMVYRYAYMSHYWGRIGNVKDAVKHA